MIPTDQSATLACLEHRSKGWETVEGFTDRREERIRLLDIRG